MTEWFSTAVRMSKTQELTSYFSFLAVILCMELTTDTGIKAKHDYNIRPYTELTWKLERQERTRAA